MKRELIKISDVSHSEKIRQLISESIKLHVPIEVKRAKKILQKIYDYLEIKKTAKSTDLKKYFEVKESCKNSVRYVELVAEKLITKQPLVCEW